MPSDSQLINGMPQCAVCKRSVDCFVTYYNWMLHSHVLVAYCHGDHETVLLSDELLVEADRDGIKLNGQCFVPKQLTETKLID
jgi:hypothetical protein